MREPDPDFAPCQLVEYRTGSFSLLFLDLGANDVFVQLGREGNGYDWQAVIEYLLCNQLPELTTSIRYDSEASMFVAISNDRNALKLLAGLVQRTIADPTLLREAAIAALH